MTAAETKHLVDRNLL